MAYNETSTRRMRVREFVLIRLLSDCQAHSSSFRLVPTFGHFQKPYDDTRQNREANRTLHEGFAFFCHKVTKSKATQCQRRIPPQSSGIQRIDWLDCSEAAHIGLLSHQHQKNQHIAAPFKRRPTFVLVDRITSICHIACNIRIVDIKDPLEEFLSLPISPLQDDLSWTRYSPTFHSPSIYTI